jgi:hypothetical protein
LMETSTGGARYTVGLIIKRGFASLVSSFY